MGDTDTRDLTRQVADYAVAARLEDIPADALHEARRALLNYMGCALGGSGHRAMDITWEALAPYAGPPTARVLGRAGQTDPLLAALLNGISSHVHDYDDTTPSNYIHPTSPVASALFSYASMHPVTGADLLLAYALGYEVVTRIGDATYPAHYQAGWHSTGSVGVFGAAVAIGKLLRLDERQMVWAIGLAATQSAGLREMFGSMAKSFHPGRAAQGGYTAALLAQRGFTAGEHALEGPRGFAAVESAAYDLRVISDGLGRQYHFHQNTYKPFPCGIVVHPTIDACIQLRRSHQIDARHVAEVRLRVAPLVRDLCDQRDISKGLQGKFSVYHAAAIGLVRGKAGLAEFTDEAVNDSLVRQVRECVVAEADASMAEDSVHVEVRMRDGKSHSLTLEHALGNLRRPLSDAQLEEKFRDQATMLPAAQVDALIAACWQLDRQADVRRLVELAVPGPA